MKQAFLVSLLDDVVVSSRAATFGGHRSLDYLPGANFLGAAAARLYGALEPAQAFRAFHSGALRFGNALPYRDGWALPMPLCLMEEKGFPGQESGRLLPDRLFNPLAGDPSKPTFRPLRHGYLTLRGEVVGDAARLRMKTAIDPDKGQAAEGQLFGYASLPRGATFAFTLSANIDFEQALFASVTDALTGVLRLGRSRSAEYGRVRVEPLAETLVLPSADVADAEVTLWLLSDLAVQDPHGQPTWQPRFEWLGLGGDLTGQLVPGKSFTAVRSYAPFNSHYRTRELERPVLSQGSVLRFRLNRPLTAAERDRLAEGIGLYQQAGLGQVWVDPPPLLAPGGIRLAPPADVTPKRAVTAPAAHRPPDHPLAHWLMARVGREQAARRAEQRAAGWISALPKLYQSARLLASASPGVRVGPSPSQWGRVLELAKQRGPGGLIERLFEGADAICKGADWAAAVHVEAAGAGAGNFADWLRRHLEAAGDDPLLPAILARVARSAIDAARAAEAPIAGGRSA